MIEMPLGTEVGLSPGDFVLDGDQSPRLAAESVSLVCGTPANFNGIRVLASLLQRRRSTEANQTFTMFGPYLGW